MSGQPDAEPRDGGSGGFALLVVLSFLLLAASLSTPFFSSARDYAFASRNSLEAARDDAMARGVIAVASQRYLEVSRRAVAMPLAISCGPVGRYGSVDIAFQNHAGLIDLNAAPPELLQVGFAALGVPAADARKLAAVADAYRAAELGNRRDGAAALVVGGLKHAPFEAVDELLDFRLPPVVGPADLATVFTVYSRSGSVDENAAPAPLRAAFAAARREASTYLAAGGGALPAYGVTVALRNPRGLGVTATQAFVAEDGETVRPVTPVALARRAGDAAVPPGAADCASFFDEGSLALIGELAR